MKALITAPFDENELQRLSKVVEVTYENWRETGKVYMDGDEFSEHLKHGNYEILIVEADEIDESVLSLEPLKLVASCRSNPVNVEIDIATQKGVCVLNTPHRNADAVADLTIALILSSVRKVTEVNIFLRQNPDFELEDEEEMSSFFRKFTGFELGGKTVGIVGFGGIGSRVANRLHFGFDMKILVYDPFVKEEDPQLKKVKGVLVSLNDLLRQSDVVTVHAMPTPENDEMIGEDEFALMKPTAHFINTSRSYLTDEDALFDILKAGKIAGAGLDVFEDEPVAGDNRFLELPNVTVTPHLGGQTFDVVRHQSRIVVDGIIQWLKGEKPSNLVNAEVWNKNV